MDFECRGLEGFGDLFNLGFSIGYGCVEDDEGGIPLCAWRLPLVFARPLLRAVAVRETTPICAASELLSRSTINRKSSVEAEVEARDVVGTKGC
jgi:hypothetical protein